MVDGVLLLVDASEGPLPQTRFVLRKALEGAPAGDPRRQQGRPARRAHRRGRPRGLRAVPRPRRRRGPDRLPDRLHQRPGRPGVARPQREQGTDLRPLLDLLVEHIPPPSLRPRAIRCRRSSPTSTPSPTSGAWRSAACATGTIRKRPGDRLVPRRRRDRQPRARSPSSTSPRRLDRVDGRRGGPGRDHRASPASPDVTIGETLADPDDPRPLPVIRVDEPSLGVTIGINTSPLAGQRRRQADRPPGRRRASTPGARRQRLPARRADRAPGRLGGPGPRRAAARGARRDDAPRGLRADRRPAAGRDARGRRRRARADGAPVDRRARGLRRRRHPAARAAQGPPGADGQPRHGLGAHGLPGPRPRA